MTPPISVDTEYPMQNSGSDTVVKNDAEFYQIELVYKDGYWT